MLFYHYYYFKSFEEFEYCNTEMSIVDKFVEMNDGRKLLGMVKSKISFSLPPLHVLCFQFQSSSSLLQSMFLLDVSI